MAIVPILSEIEYFMVYYNYAWYSGYYVDWIPLGILLTFFAGLIPVLFLSDEIKITRFKQMKSKVMLGSLYVLIYGLMFAIPSLARYYIFYFPSDFYYFPANLDRLLSGGVLSAIGFVALVASDLRIRIHKQIQFAPAKGNKEQRQVASLKMTADPINVVADGNSEVILSLKLLDKSGNATVAPSDIIVRLSASKGKLPSAVQVIPRGEFQVTTILIASSEPGSTLISASTVGLEKAEVMVHFESTETTNTYALTYCCKSCFYCGRWFFKVGFDCAAAR